MKEYLRELVKNEMSEYWDGAYADSGCAKDQLERLVLKVEQATLERAAKVCDNVSEWKSIWDAESGASYGANVCASEIRALKESND